MSRPECAYGFVFLLAYQHQQLCRAVHEAHIVSASPPQSPVAASTTAAAAFSVVVPGPALTATIWSGRQEVAAARRAARRFSQSVRGLPPRPGVVVAPLRSLVLVASCCSRVLRREDWTL